MPRPRAVTFSTLAAGLVAAVGVVPDRLGLDRRFPFVDTVSLRPQATVAALATSALLAQRRRTRPAALGVAAVGLVGLASVLGRVPRRPAPVLLDPVELAILSVNVLKGRADTGELATLIERERPHVVVLPEAGHDFRDKLEPLVQGLGYRSWVSTDQHAPDVRGVTLLVADELGDVEVRVVREMRLPHLEVTGGLLGRRKLYAMHATAPLLRQLIPAWQRDMGVLARWCAATPAPIVVGDFNATLDHSAMRAALGNCHSAALGTGRALVGTYPSSFPRWFGIQIDHALVPAGTATRRFEVIDVEGTDHRGILVEVGVARA
jgi:endonuclease/exonuclease/phosphatase (EEP) superfamily protein YafD